MPADQVRQTRAVFDPIVSRHRPAGGEFGASEEIADLLKWCAVLKGEAHQAGNDVVESDDLGRAISSFDSKEEFGGAGVVVDAKIERTLPGDANLLGDVSAAGR
jgi:hypothetical protein